MSYNIIFTDELYHHGVKGQKWGIRRYQNLDGSYKSGAQGRYNDDGSPGVNKNRKTNGSSSIKKTSGGSKVSKNNGKPKKKMSTKKKVAIGLGVAGTALAAYGAYKYSKHIKDKASKQIIANGEAAYDKLMAKSKDSLDYANTFHKEWLKTGNKADWYLYEKNMNAYGRERAGALGSYRRSLNKASETGASFRKSFNYLNNRGQADKKTLGALGALGAASTATVATAALRPSKASKVSKTSKNDQKEIPKSSRKDTPKNTIKKNNSESSKAQTITLKDPKSGKPTTVKLDNSFKVRDQRTGKLVPINTLDPKTQVAILNTMMRR